MSNFQTEPQEHGVRRTRYTCPSSGDRVAPAHPEGSSLACPLCGRHVAVVQGRLPTHNYRTKKELQHGR